jgi:hypothetical protein
LAKCFKKLHQLDMVLAVTAPLSKPSETKGIKAQLSIAGVVAAAFEDVRPQTKDLIAEWRTGTVLLNKILSVARKVSD